MRSMDQFRAEYSRTRHVGAEPDASHHSPASSHGPLVGAYNRVNEFATAMAQDLQLLDRHHAVSSSIFLYGFLRSGDFSSGGCAQAHPLGVVPEIRADCLQSIRIFYAFRLLFLAFLLSRDFASSGCAQAHPLGVVPDIRADWFVIGSDLLYFLLLLLISPAFLLSGDFSSGGCAQAHPLGVVPEIRADCLQLVWIFYAFCFFFLPFSDRETFFPVGARKRTHWV